MCGLFIAIVSYIIGFQVSKSYYKVDEKEIIIKELEIQKKNLIDINDHDIDFLIKISSYLIEQYDDFVLEKILVKYGFLESSQELENDMAAELLYYENEEKSEKNIQFELNTILDKINTHGYNSLSSDEKNYLNLYKNEK
jgi:hypothetical protein